MPRRPGGGRPPPQGRPPAAEAWPSRRMAPRSRHLCCAWLPGRPCGSLAHLTSQPGRAVAEAGMICVVNIASCQAGASRSDAQVESPARPPRPAVTAGSFPGPSHPRRDTPHGLPAVAGTPHPSSAHGSITSQPRGGVQGGRSAGLFGAEAAAGRAARARLAWEPRARKALWTGGIHTRRVQFSQKHPDNQ